MEGKKGNDGMDGRGGLQHFLLTRFNILLWQKDKQGRPVRTTGWLEHRFALFERFCLPSVMAQTCRDFEWIVLFDSMTPERYRSRIDGYREACPQLTPVFVEPGDGRHFARIFREQAMARLRAGRVLTTYLDNDDALHVGFVEDLQGRASQACDGTFFYYDDGYQYYADDRYLLRIHYPRNHFVSVVEGRDAFRGIFGYGSHYYIDTIGGVRIEHVRDLPMWCEVVHGKNMVNDANFLLGTRMVRDARRLRRDFAVDETVGYGAGTYLFRFLPRYLRTFVRRTRNFLFGRKW